MFTLKKEFRFEAAHQLVRHDGKCARLHGHSWLMTVEIRGGELHHNGPKANMLMDYSDISTVVKPFVDAMLDHHFLNETFCENMPTSEFIAQRMYELLKPSLPDLQAVTINETCTSECRYERAEL